MTENPVFKMIQEMRTRVRKDLYGGTLNYEAAIALLKRQVPIAEKLGDNLLRGQLYETLGTVELEMGNYEKGFDYYLNALAMMESVDDQYRVGIMLNNLGEIHRRWGHPNEAKDYYLRARELALEANQNTLVVTTYNNEGQVWVALGDIEQAIQVLETGLKLATEGVWEKDTFKSTIPELRSNLAESYARLGRFDEAWDTVKKAYDAATQYEQVYQLARVYQAMAFIAIQEKREPETIDDYLMMSRANWIRVASKLEIANILKITGDFWQSQGNLEKAHRAYEEAIPYFEQAYKQAQADELRQQIGLQ